MYKELDPTEYIKTSTKETKKKDKSLITEVVTGHCTISNDYLNLRNLGVNVL